jgi:putative PEP-CTERM system histidine kinase
MLFMTREFVWTKIALLGLCVLPGSLAVFSLTFARQNYQESLKQWKALLAVIFGCSLWFLYQGFSGAFLVKTTQLSLQQFEIYRIQQVGLYFLMFLLLSMVFVLYNLEHTYRNASNVLKWQIKYLILGIFAAAFFDIFLISYMLLYRIVRVEYFLAEAIILILVGVLILFSLVRYRLMETDVFISRQVVYNSFVIFVTGTYLLTIAVIGYLVKYQVIQHEITQFLVVEVFMYVAIIGLMILLLSESIRQRVERYISKHFYRHKYEYDEVWIAFTRHIGSKISLDALLPQLVTSLQEIINTERVYIFLQDGGDQVILQESSVSVNTSIALPLSSQFVQYFQHTSQPQVDISAFHVSPTLESLYREQQQILTDLNIELCAPLRVKDTFIGLLAVGPERTDEPYTHEDYALLHTIATQATSAILNAKLSEDLSHARALETFHKFSAFIVHDLKNAVQSLSLVVENAPDYMDEPEFWQDSLENITDTVARMNNMIARLSSVPEKLDIKPVPMHLAGFFEDTLHKSKVSKLNHVSISIDLEDPDLTVPIDVQHFQSVLLNLLSNAAESINGSGEIRIQAGHTEQGVMISVSDTGCGISPEHLKELFTPFKSTKRKGLGIGLYQSKTIVEAHGGKIMTESAVGQGTTFSIELPGGESNI